MTQMMRLESSSQKENLLGSQEPSERICPQYDVTDGGDAAKVLKAGKFILDPWQQTALNDWLAIKADGQWVCGTCGCSVPRQNGKSGLVQARADAGMILYNEQVIYTAHLQKTATETFEEMAEYFETPKLKSKVKDIKTAIGREQIILKTGARVKFLARTRNGGRGQHGDLLIFDEAQELDYDAQASFIPAISASLRPQVIYCGTPPDPTAPGVVFRSIRDNAIEGKTEKTAWMEFSTPDLGDITDRSRWAATNPALGIRILPSTIEAEIEQLAPDDFARERLGWWTPVKETKEVKAIDESAWDACASNDPKPEGKTAYGIKFSVDGSEVCLCGAVIPTAGKARISIIDRKPTGQGIRWLADFLNQRYSRACCVVIDGRNGVDVLIDRIADTWRMKDAIIKPNAKEMLAAVGTMIDSINEQSVTWYKPQEALRNSAVTSTKRDLAGGWAFGGEDSIPIEAASLALWGARTSKRDPAKRMRIG